VPRPKNVEQTTKSLVASARRYTGKSPVMLPSKDWQERAYHHYRNSGIARFAARYFGHAMSRSVLFVADSEGKRRESGGTVDDLNALFSGKRGQAEILESAGVHLIVAGECYLVGRSTPAGDEWGIYSIKEVTGDSTGWRIRNPETGVDIALEEDDTVIRIWIRDPLSQWEADSPFRSLLTVLDETEWLSRYIRTQAIARLTGAGILVLPDGMTFPPPPPINGKEQKFANDADAFMLTLGEDMLEPIKDPSSPAAHVPLVISVPPESIGDIKHLTFWTDLDENAREMRRDAITQFALGMDLPPEMVLGMSSNDGTGGGNSNGISHWGAWQLEEQSIKLHIEPMLEVLTQAIQTKYLDNLSEDGDYLLFDTSALRLRPDRSKEAMELYEKGEVKAETLRAENGFDETDAPDETERRNWTLRKVATGSPSPEQVGGALRLLGIDLLVQYTGNESPGGEAPQPPSLEDHPTRPRTPEESVLLPLYESLVLRALERAGNRLRNMHETKTPGAAFEAHTILSANGSKAKCLEDAWSTAPVVLSGLADEDRVEDIITALNGYCAALMANREPHTRHALAEWCERSGI
jgi:hypothetical protein